MDDACFMEMALKEAEAALDLGELPVGCVAAVPGRVVATGARRFSTPGKTNEMDHAEVTVLRQLSELDPPPDMDRVTVYSTLEPCLMCLGAILINGINRIVYGAEDVMGGGCGLDLSRMPPLYRDRKLTIVRGVCRDQCLALFRRFFSRPENEYLKNTLLADYMVKTG